MNESLLQNHSISLPDDGLQAGYFGLLQFRKRDNVHRSLHFGFQQADWKCDR